MTTNVEKFTGWICEECGHASDREDAPCDCDDDWPTQTNTIKSLRQDLKRALQERDEIRSVVERDTAERIAMFADAEAETMDDAAKNAPTQHEAEACRQEAASLRQFAIDIRNDAWKAKS